MTKWITCLIILLVVCMVLVLYLGGVRFGCLRATGGINVMPLYADFDIWHRTVSCIEDNNFGGYNNFGDCVSGFQKYAGKASCLQRGFYIIPTISSMGENEEGGIEQ